MPEKLTISIIGAGRVGQTLARLWHDQGHMIQAVVCRRQQSALRAVRFIGAGNPAFSSLQTLPQSRVFLLSVPDDELGLTVEKLRNSSTDLRGSVFLHTSGSLNSTILGPLAKTGAAIGSMHPLLSFSSPKLAIQQVAGGFFCVEGDMAAARIAKRLIKSIGAQAFEISPSDKSLYHAAAVMASPQLTALLSLSIEMLIRCGLSEPQARKVLLPLVQSSVDNLSKQSAAEALTGPVTRGDMATVERNLGALAKVSPVTEEVYRLLSLQAVKLSTQSGVSSEKLASIIAKLENRKGPAI